MVPNKFVTGSQPLNTSIRAHLTRDFKSPNSHQTALALVENSLKESIQTDDSQPDCDKICSNDDSNIDFKAGFILALFEADYQTFLEYFQDFGHFSSF